MVEEECGCSVDEKSELPACDPNNSFQGMLNVVMITSLYYCKDNLRNIMEGAWWSHHQDMI